MSLFIVDATQKNIGNLGSAVIFSKLSAEIDRSRMKECRFFVKHGYSDHPKELARELRQLKIRDRDEEVPAMRDILADIAEKADEVVILQM